MGETTRDVIVAELVARCLFEAEEYGREPDVASICRDHPDAEAEVREVLTRTSELGRVHAESAGFDPLIGKLMADRYSIESRVGSGAMGVVYVASDLELGRRVALKMLLGTILDRDTAIARFDREASALAAVDHPAVVKIFDRGVTAQGVPFLVMELIDGHSCADLVAEARQREDSESTDWLVEAHGIAGELEPSLIRQSVRWCRDIAAGLEAVHGAGIVHRDVKPSNVMIRRDGSAVLIDFGIAGIDVGTDGLDEGLTRTGAMIGTAAYMAPEALGKGTARATSRDIYGLSATLYHMVTLTAPYTGSTGEILAAIATREPRPAISVRPGLPREFEAVLDAGLAREVGNRYPSMEAMREDLDALLEFRPLSVRPIGRVRRLARRARRSRAVRWSAAAVLATAGVFAGLEWRDALSVRAQVLAGERFDDGWGRVPTNLATWNPAWRSLPEPHKAEVERALDDTVASGHGLVSALTLRAGFRHDHGDPAGAAEDIERLAQLEGSSWLEELARRYRALPADSHLSSELDLEGMPEPESETERYVRAFHHLRVQEYGPAVRLLPEDPSSSAIRHAAEMAFVGKSARVNGLRRAKKFEAAKSAAADLIDEVIRYEQSTGLMSSTTGHVRGIALAVLRRWPDALEVTEGVLESAPASVPIRVNASKAALEVGDIDRAVEHAIAGLEIAPVDDKLWNALIKAHIEEGDYPRALERLDHSVFSMDEDMGKIRANLETEVILSEAVSLIDTRPGRAEELARRALVTVQELDADSKWRGHWERLANAILADGRTDLAGWLIDELGNDVFSRSHLRNLAELLTSDPDALGPEHLDALTLWIIGLAERSDVMPLKNDTTTGTSTTEPRAKR